MHRTDTSSSRATAGDDYGEGHLTRETSASTAPTESSEIGPAKSSTAPTSLRPIQHVFPTACDLAKYTSVGSSTRATPISVEAMLHQAAGFIATTSFKSWKTIQDGRIVIHVPATSGHGPATHHFANIFDAFEAYRDHTVLFRTPETPVFSGMLVWEAATRIFYALPWYVTYASKDLIHINDELAQHGLEVVDVMVIHVAIQCYDTNTGHWNLDSFLDLPGPETRKPGLDDSRGIKVGEPAEPNQPLPTDAVKGSGPELPGDDKSLDCLSRSVCTPELAQRLVSRAAEVAARAPKQEDEDPIMDQLRSYATRAGLSIGRGARDGSSDGLVGLVVAMAAGSCGEGPQTCRYYWTSKDGIDIEEQGKCSLEEEGGVMSDEAHCCQDGSDAASVAASVAGSAKGSPRCETRQGPHQVVIRRSSTVLEHRRSSEVEGLDRVDFSSILFNGCFDEPSASPPTPISGHDEATNRPGSIDGLT